MFSLNHVLTYPRALFAIIDAQEGSSESQPLPKRSRIYPDEPDDPDEEFDPNDEIEAEEQYWIDRCENDDPGTPLIFGEGSDAPGESRYRCFVMLFDSAWWVSHK